MRPVCSARPHVIVGGRLIPASISVDRLAARCKSGGFKLAANEGIGQTKFTGLHTKTELQLTSMQKKLFRKPSVHQTYPEYYLIRTTKFNDVINDSLDEWIYFFKNSEVLDDFRAKGMEEVREKLNVMNMDDEERKRYKKFIERLSDEASYAETLKIEAEERVRVDEKKKNFIEIAIKFIKSGYENGTIHEFTDLKIEEIEALRKQVNEGNI